MSILDSLMVAVTALATNLLRSILTTLGIVIGVASVIILVAVGTGASSEVDRQIAALLNATAPVLLELRDEAQYCTELADKTGKKLGEIRQELAALDHQRRIAVQDLAAKGKRSRTPAVDPDDLKPKTTAAVVATPPARSIEERLKELDK